MCRIGGGDRNLGETGHLGVSLRVSDAAEGFCGPAALARLSDGAGSTGVVAADSVFVPVVVVAEPAGKVDLVGRVGLGSC